MKRDATAGAIFTGKVMHARLHPKRHRFTYRVYTLLIDIERIDEAVAGTRLMSRNRFNLFSFYDRDHGYRDGRPLRQWVQDRLGENGLGFALGRVRLVTFPRVLGYVFNPISTYYCEDQGGRLSAIIYEVNNTFGDSHAYVAPVTADEGPLAHAADKVLYVSPLMEMGMRYHFRVQPPGEHDGESMALNIRETDGKRDVLLATLNGTRKPLRDARLACLLVTHPLLTLMVTAGIHWQALRIWLKGVRHVRRPAPPAPPSSLAEAGKGP